jgi:predicted Fe-Mo cluster-binding NifX family protein
MKIAITAENNNGLESNVAQHFGHAPYFIFVEVENGEITSTNGIANPYAEAHQPGEIPNYIHSQNANVILSGGMGGRAIQFFEQLNVKAATGASGTVREALEKYLGGSLKAAAPCDESVAHGHG